MLATVVGLVAPAGMPCNLTFTFAFGSQSGRWKFAHERGFSSLYWTSNSPIVIGALPPTTSALLHGAPPGIDAPTPSLFLPLTLRSTGFSGAATGGCLITFVIARPHVNLPLGSFALVTRSGSWMVKNCWSVVNCALFVEMRTWQERTSASPFPGDGSFGDKQLK